jgi:hypothetical protein
MSGQVDGEYVMGLGKMIKESRHVMTIAAPAVHENQRLSAASICLIAGEHTLLAGLIGTRRRIQGAFFRIL